VFPKAVRLPLGQALGAWTRRARLCQPSSRSRETTANDGRLTRLKSSSRFTTSGKLILGYEYDIPIEPNRTAIFCWSCQMERLLPSTPMAVTK